MYALESFVCQEAWIKPAIAPHLPVWPSNSPSCKNKGDFTAPSSHISYKKHRVTAFSSLMTDRQGRQTDRHIAACHLLLFLAHTGMALYFPVVQGLLASCLPSVSCRWVTRDARQGFLRTPTEAISDSGAGPASFLPLHSLTFTEMNLLALSDSCCQVPPQQRQKKATGLTISKNNRKVLFFL